MLSVTLTIASVLGHGVARFAVTAAVITLIAPLVIVGLLTLTSILDVAFFILDAMHGPATEAAALSLGAPSLAVGG